MENQYVKSFYINEDKKKEFEKICNKLSKSIIEGRQNPQKLDYNLLNKNRKIILEKLDNIDSMIDKIGELEMAKFNKDNRIIETFNIVKFTGSALNKFKEWVNKAKDEFKKIIDSAHDLAREAVSAIEDATTDLYNKAAGAIQKTFNQALGAAKGLINDAKGIAVDIYDDAVEGVLTAVDTVKDGALDTINTVYEGLEQAWSAVTDTFYNLAGSLTDFVGDIGSMGEKLLKGLNPKTVKRKNEKSNYATANFEDSPQKIPLSDADEELTSADISTNTLISDRAMKDLNELGVSVKVEYDQDKTDTTLDSSIQEINELNIPGLKYNEEAWKHNKTYKGDMGECKPGSCLEGFDNNDLSLKPFNYFNNFSSF